MTISWSKQVYLFNILIEELASTWNMGTQVMDPTRLLVSMKPVQADPR